MVTETVQVVVHQWFLTIIEPDVVVLALIESTAVSGHEDGEVKASTVGRVVSDVNGTSSVANDGESGFCESRRAGSVASDIARLVAGSI